MAIHYLIQLEQLERLRSEITPTAPWLPIIHIRSQVKTKQTESYKLKKIAKYSKFEILHKTLHAAHLLKLLDKMYKYEMDPTRTVGATERTHDAGWTDGQTNKRTDRPMEWNQYTPPQLRCARGMIIMIKFPYTYMHPQASIKVLSYLIHWRHISSL